MNFKGKYEQIAESTLVRYQTGGILIGDLVKVRKNALKHPKLAELGDHVKANIKKLIETGLNLRVSAIKSIHPSSGDNANGLGMGTTSAPTDFWCDVVIETAPGLWSNPMTLPIEVLDVVDTGINGAPIPDELKRKGKITIKPEEVKYSNERTVPQADTRTLPTKNTVLDFVKGSAKQPVLKDSVQGRVNDADMLAEAYAKVLNAGKTKILTVCIPNVFADNVESFLATENMKHFKTTNGQKTYFDVVFGESKEKLEQLIRKNAMGDMTFLTIVESDQQIEENSQR
jgi:hypothetical protein